MKKIKFDKTVIKTTSLIVVGAMFCLYFFNLVMLYKTENKINQLNGYKTPKKSYFSNMQLKFKDVSCHGFFINPECIIDNPQVKVLKTNNFQEYTFIESDKIEIHNLNYETTGDININLDIKNLNFGKDLKKIMNEKNKEFEVQNNIIDNNLFPLNGFFKLDLKKGTTFKGYINYGLNNNLLDYSYKANIEMGNNKKQMADINVGDDKRALIELKNKEFGIIKDFDFQTKIKKDLIPTLYAIYYINVANIPNKQAFNNYLFGAEYNETIPENEFRIVLANAFLNASISYHNEGQKFQEFIYKAYADVINKKRESIFVHGENKNGMTAHEQNLITGIKQTVMPTEVENNFKFSIK